jgi:hypothetical protein
MNTFAQSALSAWNLIASGDTVLLAIVGRSLADLPVHDFFHGPLADETRLFFKGEWV